MVSCVRMWRGLGEGNWASLLICQADSYVRITLSWLYDSDYGMYTITRELRDYAHGWEELERRFREDPQGLWRQALQDIVEDYRKKMNMANVLRVAEAIQSTLS
jgi:hypothetical protein